MLLVAAILAVTQAASADSFAPDTKLYFKPNHNWAEYHATFTATFFNDRNENSVVRMTRNYDDVWECSVPESTSELEWTHAQIQRHDANYEGDWGGLLSNIRPSGENDFITLMECGIGRYDASQVSTFTRYTGNGYPTFQLMAGPAKADDFSVEPYDESGEVFKAKITYSFGSGAWFNVCMNDITLFGPETKPTEISALPFEYDSLIIPPDYMNSFQLNQAATVTITFLYNASDPDNTPYDLNIYERLTVLPARVRTWSDAAGWAKVTPEHPAIYLLGDVLNAGRATPEYELLPNADYSEYVIEHFAMRSCEVQAVAYMDKDGASITFGKQAVDPFVDTKFSDYAMTPGIDYRAVCRKENGEWTLTLTPNSLDDPNAKNLPPYMSMVGYNFRQLTKEVTPNVDGYRTLKYSDIDADSDTGWQEAWLQQDSEGELLRDINGRVMYNTMWPPKNQIFFNAVKAHDGAAGEVIDEQMELNSNNLTMLPYRVDGKVVVKKGSEWKALLNGDDPSSDYYNLFHSELDDYAVSTTGTASGRYWIQSMDDNNYYARYVVPRVWILGATKIWTGWTGRIVSGANGWAGADWTAHLQWGFKYDKENNGGSAIVVNKPHPLEPDRGNFLFEKPTYFKSVEFFYCLGNTLTEEHDNVGAIYYNSLLYTTRSDGDPSIRARAYNNKDGNYKMQLDDMLNDGVTVSGIEIRRYSATKSTTEAWVPVTSANQTCTEDAALVKSWEGSWTPEQFNADFTEWNLDERTDLDLAEGKYFYGMTLIFSDGSREEKIKSNPFTIVKADVEVNPDVYQLCKLVEARDGYDYVTFAPEATKAYLVKMDAESVEYAETKVPAVDEYLDGTLMHWTDLMFVQNDVPAKFLANNPKYSIDKITGYKLLLEGDTPQTLAESVDEAKSYAAILKYDFKRDIEVELSLYYYVTVEQEAADGSGTVKVDVDGDCTPVIKKFTYTFPVPTFGPTQSSVEIYGPNSVTAPYAEKGEFANLYSLSAHQANEHALNVAVPVLAPNISDEVTLDAATTVSADGNTWAYDGKSNTAVLFKNQDPNKWINTADNSYSPIAHIAELTTTEYAGCNQYPTEAGYTRKAVEIESDIRALTLGDIKVFNAIVRCDEAGNIDPSSQANNYRALLAIATAEIEDEDNLQNHISDTSLAHHDDWSHYAFKAGAGESMELKADEEEGFHHHSYFSDASKLAVIAVSDPFHWYAEMDDELFNVEDYKVAIARAYFFTNEESGVEFDGTAAQKALYAPSAEAADATHYTFLARFSEARQLDRDDIMTSVNDLIADRSVKAGQGWLEVNGENVAVYSVDGVCIAASNGRYSVPAGVYVVSINGNQSKVIVK